MYLFCCRDFTICGSPVSEFGSEFSLFQSRALGEHIVNRK